ncbi:MAG: hypothetical protein K6B52_04060, partial [Clostridiales bacterium]|nr:hypothetical protein [Clostridiales bacterium]
GWETLSEPTFEQDGVKIIKCSDCGTTLDSKPISKLSVPKIRNNPGTRTIEYKQTITLYADYTALPKGYSIQWFVDEAMKGTGDKIKIINPTADFEVKMRIVDSGGNEHTSSQETVKVKHGFFDKLSSFFKRLFGSLKDIEQ